MQFSVSAPGPLKGHVKLPGDLMMTLTSMSFAMLLGEPFEITHPSCAPKVEPLRSFLVQHGAEFTEIDDGFIFKGQGFNGDISIGMDVPDDVIHILVSGSVFTVNSVRISGGSSIRAGVIDPVLERLKLFGLDETHIESDGEDIIVKGTEFTASDMFVAKSDWDFEIILAVLLAARESIEVSFNPSAISPMMKVCQLFGLETTSESNLSTEDELERRLAKAAGEPRSLKMQKLQWTGKYNSGIDVPGDSTIAAALAGCAVLTQRSDILIENVFWNDVVKCKVAEVPV